jgi:DNA-binding SARP family transcriptional activator
VAAASGRRGRLRVAVSSGVAATSVVVPEAAVKLIGRPRMFVGGHWQTLAPDRRGQLLAYLAVEGEWISRDRLADLLWHELTMIAARRNLRHLVHVIKRRAPVAGLEVTREAMRWSPASDLARTRAALAAGAVEDLREHCSGALLDGFEARVEGPLARWLEVERERLRRRCRDAVLARVREEAAAGRVERAAALAMALVEGEADEEAVLQAVRALRDGGSSELARSLIDRYVRVLARDLHTAPGAEVLQLAETLARRAATVVPAQRHGLVGRADELALIEQWWEAGDRLVTLLGPPGIGKSALARAVAERHVASGARVAAIGMATAKAAPAAAARVARGLGGTADDRAAPERALTRLAEAFDLIVLDDVAASAVMAPLVGAMLRGKAPRLLVVAPEPLRMPEERVLHLDGLAYAGASGGSVGDAAPPALALFVRHAVRGDPTFLLTPQLEASARSLVAAVEGSPLAIELAAGWVGILPLEEIAGRVIADVDFLSDPHRWAPLRHRSLRAAYEHAVEPLDAAARRAFEGLSIFSSSFSLAAASAVGGVSPATVATLVDHALLQRSVADRYAVPSSLRPFARQALQFEPSSHLCAQDALARFAVGRARDALRDDATLTPEAAAALDREQPLLDEACALAVARGSWDDVDDLTRALAAWSEVRGRHGDALQRFAQLLGSIPDTVATCRPWLRRAWLEHGRNPGAAMREVRDLEERGLLGDDLDRVAAERILGTSAWRLGRSVEGRSHLERGLALASRRGHDAWRAILLDGLGLCLAASGSYARAESAQREALMLNERLGTSFQAVQNLINLASHARRRDDHRASVGYARRAVELAEAIDYRPYIAHAQTQLALSLLAAGRPSDAFGAASEAVGRAAREGDGYVRTWSALVLATVAEAEGRTDAPVLLTQGLRSAWAAGDAKQLARGLLIAARFAWARGAADLSALVAAAVEAVPGADASTRRDAAALVRSLPPEGPVSALRALRRRARGLGLAGVLHEFEAAVAAWAAAA